MCVVTWLASNLCYYLIQLFKISLWLSVPNLLLSFDSQRRKRHGTLTIRFLRSSQEFSELRGRQKLHSWKESPAEDIVKQTCCCGSLLYYIIPAVLTLYLHACFSPTKMLFMGTKVIYLMDLIINLIACGNNYLLKIIYVCHFMVDAILWKHTFYFLIKRLLKLFTFLFTQFVMTSWNMLVLVV